MKKVIQPINKPIQARVNIPGSKSMTNRALLLAALSDGVCEIKDTLISDDTRAFAEALRQLGIMLRLDETTRTCIIGGASGKFPKKTAAIWCAEAGTLARFILAACAASEGEYHFDGERQLCDRPLAPLIKVLRRQGAKFMPENVDKMPFTVSGADGFSGGEIEVDSSQSGQFLSALLMAAPFSKMPVMLKAREVVSRPYVDMTCAMMADFGVLVRSMPDSRYYVPTPQRYHARDYVIEPDFSTASYFFAAAAVTAGRVTIQAVDRKNSLQGDAAFLEILEKMGCRVIENQEGLSVEGSADLHGVSVNMRDFSDTFMTLAAIAPFAKTATTITNIGHTRLQESDRIKAMHEGLAKLKIKVEEGPDWLKIYPGTPQGATIDAHNDHRIAMAFSVIGLRTPGVEIEGAECVAKTCPEFFSMWELLYG